MSNNSFVQYTADGLTAAFSITFGYISVEHVAATVDGVEDGSAVISGGTTMTLSSTPTSGQVVELRRTTPTTPIVDFSDASVLTESDLDTNQLQFLYIAEEQIDKANTALNLASDATFDAESKRIKNVADPTAAQDAVTLNYLNTTYVATLDAKVTSAQAAQTAAETAETNAGTSETNAASSASAASTSASNASTSASNAATSASNASTSETNAAASAASAATSAAQAEGQLSYTAKSSSFTISDTADAFQGRFGVTAGAAIDISLDGAYTPADGDWFEIWDIDDTFDDYTVRLVLDNTEFFDPEGGTFTHVVLDFKTNKGIANFRYVFAYDGGAAKWKKV